MTRSPTATPSTAAPTSVTSPAISQPGTNGSGGSDLVPALHEQGVDEVHAARPRRAPVTWPGPQGGVSSWRTSRASGSPKASQTTARMAGPYPTVGSLGAVDLDAALADARPEVLWLDSTDRPGPRAPLAGATSADLVVVGAGYTGFWAALRARIDHPSLDVLLVDARRGRRRGLGPQRRVRVVLAHPRPRERRRALPRGRHALLGAGRQNFDGLVAESPTTGIDAHLELTGALRWRTEPWQVPGVRESVELHRRHGEQVDVLDATALRGRAGLADLPGGDAGSATARRWSIRPDWRWGLADACERLGVRIAEGTDADRARAPRGAGAGRSYRPRGPSGAARSSWAPTRSARRCGRSTVGWCRSTTTCWPPSRSTTTQLASIGWSEPPGRLRRRQPVPLLPAHRGSTGSCGAATTRCSTTGGAHRPVARPAARDPSACWRQHFFETFPQLDGVRFTHRWGGVIDTSTRFSVGFRHRLRRSGRVRGRLHRAGGGGDPVRRPGVPRPAVPARLRAAVAGPGAQGAAAVPAGAGALRRHPADPPGDRPRRCQPRGVGERGSRLLDRLGLGFDT